MSTKRSAPDSSTTSQPSSKRTGTLGSYMTIIPPPPPSLIVHSPPFTDRRSTFVAHAAPCTTKKGAEQFQRYIRDLRSAAHPKEADHEIWGWRGLDLRVGKNGLGGEDDYVVKLEGEDDGEKGGGLAVKRRIEQCGGVDCVVVVSRWYGGIMLGQDRWKHIDLVVTQALTLLEQAQALPDLITRLSQLDSEILELAPPTTSSPDKGKATTTSTYATLDVPKAERLIKAREKRIELLLRKKKEEEDELAAAVEAEMLALDGQGVVGGGDDTGAAGAGANDDEDEAALAEAGGLS